MDKTKMRAEVTSYNAVHNLPVVGEKQSLGWYN